MILILGLQIQSIAQKLPKLIHPGSTFWRCFIFAFSALSPFAYAQKPISFYYSGLNSNPEYLAKVFAKSAAVEKYAQARAKWLPYLSASVNNQIQRQDATYADNSSLPRPAIARNWNLQLIIPVLHPENFGELSRAEKLGLQGELQLQLSRQDFAAKIAHAYIRLLEEREIQTSFHEEVANFAELARYSALGVKRGASNSLDDINVQIKLLNSSSEMDSEHENYVAAKLSLEKSSGLRVQSLPTMNETGLTKLDISTDGWIEFSRTSSLELKLKKLEDSIAVGNVEKSKKALLPKLDIVLSRSKNFTSDNSAIPAFFAGQTLVYSNSASIQLSMPLYAGGEGISRIREAVALESQASEEVAAANLDLERKVRDATLAIRAGEVKMNSKIAIGDLLSVNESIFERAVSKGVRPNIDLIEARQKLFSNRRDLIRARYSIANNLIDLWNACGVAPEAIMIMLSELLADDKLIDA